MNRNTHLGALNQWLLTQGIKGELNIFDKEMCFFYPEIWCSCIAKIIMMPENMFQLILSLDLRLSWKFEADSISFLV